MADYTVYIEHREGTSYPTDFNPSKAYPEYPYEEVSAEKNDVYDMIRSNKGYLS